MNPTKPKPAEKRLGAHPVSCEKLAAALLTLGFPQVNPLTRIYSPENPKTEDGKGGEFWAYFGGRNADGVIPPDQIREIFEEAQTHLETKGENITPRGFQIVADLCAEIEELKLQPGDAAKLKSAVIYAATAAAAAAMALYPHHFADVMTAPAAEFTKTILEDGCFQLDPVKVESRKPEPIQTR